MQITCDLLFKSQMGYDDLVNHLRSNERFVFLITRESKIDRRLAKSKTTGWVRLEHKNPSMPGYIRLEKKKGRCLLEISDESGGRLTGAWISWLIRNASEMLLGLDIRWTE